MEREIRRDQCVVRSADLFTVDKNGSEAIEAIETQHKFTVGVIKLKLPRKAPLIRLKLPVGIGVGTEKRLGRQTGAAEFKFNISGHGSRNGDRTVLKDLRRVPDGFQATAKRPFAIQ